MPNDLLPHIPAPPDATELSEWRHHGPDLSRRPFVGVVREAAGFVVRVEGVQRENGSCTRMVVITAGSSKARLKFEAVRQLAAALSAAADQIEVLR